MAGAGATLAGPGYDLSPAQRLFLFTRADTIYGGSNEIQRNIVAERGSAFRGGRRAMHQADTADQAALRETVRDFCRKHADRRRAARTRAITHGPAHGYRGLGAANRRARPDRPRH